MFECDDNPKVSSASVRIPEQMTKSFPRREQSLWRRNLSHIHEPLIHSSSEWRSPAAILPGRPAAVDSGAVRSIQANGCTRPRPAAVGGASAARDSTPRSLQE